MSYCGDYDAYDGDLNPDTYMLPKGRSNNMSTVTGTIEKAIRNKAGYYAVLVNDNWYSTYTNDYSNLEGQTVKFEFTKKGQYYNMKGEPEVVAAPAPAAGSAPTVTPDNRQASIVLQSSYKTAAEIAGDLLTGGVLNLGAKKADQFDNYLNFVDEIATRLFNNCINPVGFLNASSDEEAEEAAAPAKGGWNAAEA